MSCPYYWWNHNYACRKTNKDVNEDVYYKYQVSLQGTTRRP